jgi:Co/Zn/Cd efflux system component
MTGKTSSTSTNTLLRSTVITVAVLNLAYFGVEFGVANAIGSVALFADSIDFLEDASINLLVVFAIGLSAAHRRLAGLGFAALLMVPSLAAVWTVYLKLKNPTLVDAMPLTVTAIGALMVNGYCAYILARVRSTGGSLSKAAFLSARNDVFANLAIIGAGLATAASHSIWPDILVGLAIGTLNAGAALEVYEAANEEHDEVRP